MTLNLLHQEHSHEAAEYQRLVLLRYLAYNFELLFYQPPYDMSNDWIKIVKPEQMMKCLTETELHRYHQTHNA